MLAFEESVLCRAPALQVWKLLYDPVRFAEWWAVVQQGETTSDGAVLYTGEQSDSAHPVHITTARDGSRVLIRCLVTDDLYTWTLQPDDQGCRVRVRVEVAAGESERLEARHEDVLASLPELAAAAERALTSSRD